MVLAEFKASLVSRDCKEFKGRKEFVAMLDLRVRKAFKDRRVHRVFVG